MDSDLAESTNALKEALARISLPNRFGKATPEFVESAKTLLRIPRRYRDFLKSCDPTLCETKTPSENVRLLPSTELFGEQEGFALEAGQLIQSTRKNGWRRSWIIIAHSTLLGDPYFLDVSEVDAEGDCPMYTAMSGTDSWQPRLCASSFATFLRILAVSVEVARGFSETDSDYEDEFVFREALAPKIRQYDPAAVKAGHWT